MSHTKDSQGIRILVGALLIASLIIATATYSTYSDDVKQKVSETVVEMIPDLDNSLAKL